MENQNKQNSIDSRLQNEKTNIPSLSDAYKNQLTQKILNSNINHTSSKNGFAILPYRYLVIAAVVVLSFVLLYLSKEKETVVNIPKTIVVETPKKASAEDVKRLVEKLNPDQIGTYASLFLSVDSSLANKYQTEFQALGTLSSKIVTSFYDDFRPAIKAENN